MARIETLTVLFTDLVDSTRQRVRLGEDRADVLRAAHDRLVRSAIETSNGRVVKHTGDGFLAVFDGASDAVSAAVAIQQAMAAHNARAGDDALHVRIGVSAGDVSLDGDDCFGLPVVEAQRLESAAAPDQILCSSLVRALARGRGDHTFDHVGALELKGLAEPVEVDEVRWTPPAAPIAPDQELPPVLRHLGGFGFAGRDDERRAVLAEWDRAAEGATRVVVLAGEPGVGKTRLAAEVAVELVERGAIVLGGRCDELAGAPYQPFAEAVRALVRVAGPAADLGSLGAELTRLVPEVSSVVPGLGAPLAADPEAERVRFFDAVRAWLDANAAGGVVLVLDDLHWADLGTLLLLRHLVMSDPVPGLLVLGTYRDTDLDRTHPLAATLADLRRTGAVSRVVVTGLHESAVVALVTAAAGHDLDDAGVTLARSLHAETGGNAFFLSEVLRHLAESGAIERRDGVWVAGPGGAEIDLPEGVREVVGRRLTMLPDATQELLSIASVVGPAFTLDVLAALTTDDEDAIVDAIDAARRAQLVVETGVGSYRFAHALVRSTLHQELSSTRRARLHRRVATTLEGRVPAELTVADAAELAYHWSEANAAGAPEEALVYARRAAELAWAAAAPGEAARWYSHALELLDGEGDPQLTCELLVALGEAQRFAGLESAETLDRAARLAEEIGDVELMARALTTTLRSSFDQGQPANPAKVELLERTLAMADDAPAHVRAAILGALAIEMISLRRPDRQVELYEAALTAAGAIEDLETRFRITSNVQRARPWSRLTTAENRAELSAHEVGWQASDVRNRLEAASRMFWAGVHCGDRALLDLGAERQRELSRTGHPVAQDSVLLVELVLAHIEGRVDDAESLGDRARHRWAIYSAAEADTWHTSTQIQVALQRGQLPAMVDLLLSVAPERDGEDVPGIVWGLAGLALVEGGRVDGAAALVDRFEAGIPDRIPDDAALLIARAVWSATVAAAGHQGAASRLHDVLLRDPPAHLFTGGWYLGASAHYLGLLTRSLGRADEATSWFERAWDAHESFQAPPWLARTAIEWAIHERARGHAARATELVRSALDVTDGLPLPAIRGRAQSLLDTWGGSG